MEKSSGSGNYFVYKINHLPGTFSRLDDAVAQFISRGVPEGIDFTCANNYQRPPFVSWRDYTMQNKEKISAEIKTIASGLQHAAHAPD